MALPLARVHSTVKNLAAGVLTREVAPVCDLAGHILLRLPTMTAH